jgi:hypothetical protein
MAQLVLDLERYSLELDRQGQHGSKFNGLRFMFEQDGSVLIYKPSLGGEEYFGPPPICAFEPRDKLKPIRG